MNRAWWWEKGIKRLCFCAWGCKWGLWVGVVISVVLILLGLKIILGVFAFLAVGVGENKRIGLNINDALPVNNKMLRVIFDTNVYGRLIEEDDADKLERDIIEERKKGFIVYGYKAVRKEIRDIPKVTKLSRQMRIRLLTLYDRITGKHFFENSIKITLLAKKYYNYYRKLGGIYGWDTNIRIDFMIVACASVHGIDIVYSKDTRTLLSKKALKSYDYINTKDNLRTPHLLPYELLIKKFRRLI